MKTRLCALSLGALLAGGCSVESHGACETDADCVGGAVCVDGLCSGGPVPTAVIAALDQVDLGSLVALDGRNSSRAGGGNDGLTYEWSVASPSNVKIEGPVDGPTASLRTAIPHGTYKVQLVVRDQGTPSEPAIKEIKVRNTPPVASLESDPELWARNADVLLSAAGSTDADGDLLQYSWTLEKDPLTAPGSLTPGENGTATLTPGTLAAKYKVSVSVSDGQDTATASLEQTLDNTPPQIDPGEPQTVPHTCLGEGTLKKCRADFALSGTVTDLDGTIKPGSIAWAFKSGPPASNPQVVLTPTGNDGADVSVRIENSATDPLAGDYVFELLAEDNDGDESRRTVTVTVDNQAPTVSLGEDELVEVNHSFVNGKFVAVIPVSAVVSDPDDDDWTLAFEDIETTLPGASTERTAGDTALEATYTIRVDVAHPTSLIQGDTPLYTIKASVTDVNGAVTTATLPVKILNRPPVQSGFGTPGIQSIGHQYGRPGGAPSGNYYFQTYENTGLTAVDPDGDPLDIEWTVSGGPGSTSLLLDAGNDPTTVATPNTITLYSTDTGIVGSALTLTQSASDPFGAQVQGSKVFRMSNRPPTVSQITIGGPHMGWDNDIRVAYSCSSAVAACANACSTNCSVINKVNVAPWGAGGGTYAPTLAATVSDPDGDPVEVTWTKGIYCPNPPCALDFNHNALVKPGTTGPAVVNCNGATGTCNTLTGWTLAVNACVGSSGVKLHTVVTETFSIRAQPADPFGIGTTLTQPLRVTAGSPPGSICPIKEIPGS